jgi:hypothetical protein
MSEVPALRDVMGGERCWGKDAMCEEPWELLLASGQQDGKALREAWRRYLQCEAQEAAVYLGEEVDGVKGKAVEAAGREWEGILRQAIMEQQEKTRGRLLEKALEQFPNKGARPVWRWPERDKHSAQWLLCLPALGSSFTGAELSEAFAAMLCLPSPACVPRVGATVGRAVKVCRFGDTMVNQVMVGDSWRTRHTAMLMKIWHLLHWAGIRMVFEVFNLFADCIPQAGLSKIERGRKRQGLVPDARLEREAGGPATLCELKYFSASSSRYPRNSRPRDGIRAADRRANSFTALYAGKAKKVDWDYCGTPRPPPSLLGQPPPVCVFGPTETRLLSLGRVSCWCFGGFGKTSS